MSQNAVYSMSQNAVSSRYLMAAPRNGHTHAAVGTRVHQLIEAFFNQPTGPSAFAPDFAPVAYMYGDCELLRRERFPERALERVTPLIGPPIGSGSVSFDSFSPFSSFANYREARRLDREFSASEIAEALRSYRNSREYTAPVLSSRGILWPFSTLTA